MSMNTIEDILSLSPMQQGMLYHSLLAPGSGTYLEQTTWVLHGSLDISAFRCAWQQVVDRHMALRAAFLWEGLEDPVQVIYRDIELPFQYEDWSDTPEVGQHARLEGFLRADRERDFDLTVPPLMRLALIRLSPDRLVFVWTHHHLLLDGWSQPVLLNDVMLIYQGLAVGMPVPLPPPVPYSSYIAWLQHQDIEHARQIWAKELEGFANPNNLRWGQPVCAAGDNAYGVEKYEFPLAFSRNLNQFARDHGLTLNTILQGVWAMLLSRYLGEEDIVFGATVSGRPTSLSGAENIVGLLINTLPVRARIDPLAPTLDWLLAFQLRQAELREYDYTALADIQALSQVPAGTPLFQSLLVYENYPSGPFDSQLLGEFEVQAGESFSRTNYPLTFAVSPGEPIRGMIAYQADCFDSASIRRMFGHLQTLLDGIIGNPSAPVDRLPLLTEDEYRRVMKEWPENHRPYDWSATAPNLIAEQARQHPEAIALRYTDRTLTYAELECVSNRISHLLRARGAGPGNIVGLCLPACPELIIAILGIQKAGAAYLPLDPAYAGDRLAFMIADSGVQLLVTQTNLLHLGLLPQAQTILLEEDHTSGDWPEILQQPGSAPAGNPAPETLAYIIYTSGSTGKPKGARLTHRGLSNLVQASRELMNLHPGDTLLQFFSISFDPSVKEIFTTLASGATLLLAPHEQVTSPLDLQRLATSRGVTHLCCTPLYLALLHPPDLPTLKVVISGGEALGVETARRWSSRSDLMLINEYGPTETTVVAAYHLVRSVPAGEQRIPIGVPFPNVVLRILDGRLQPVPQGIAGELYIGGVGVGAGYRNRSELEAQRFLPDPFRPGERIYKTGDICRWLDDGTIDFLGRMDDQVKIRGFRVEPGEVEAVLRGQQGVEQAAVVAFTESEGGAKHLVAYLQAANGTSTPDTAGLNLRLRAILPDYMVPSQFIWLEAFPLTPSGKIDRRCLPAPDRSSSASSGTMRALFTPVQQGLADLWRQVLRVDRVTLEDGFFTLGGHSLRAAQLVSRVRDVFGVEFPLRDLFTYQTLAVMASRIELLLAESGSHPRNPIKPAVRTGNLPLSFAQQRLWFLEQLAPGNLFYNLPLAVRLKGQANLAALQHSLDAIIRRHEALRTRFVERDGSAWQQVLPEMTIPIRQVDLSGLPPQEREAAAQRVAGEATGQPFNLAEGPLLRALLICLGPDEHIALLVMHHIISDGWSLGVLLSELEAHYASYMRSEPSPLPDLPVQYADYAAWQREWLHGEPLEAMLAYWKEQLADLPPLIELPTDHPRPPVQSSRGDVYSFDVPPELAGKVEELCQDEDVTLFMALLAAFQVLLARYSGQSDIPVGTAVANRGRAEIEGLIGFFVNTLVLRTQLPEDAGFHEILKSVRETCLGAYAHQDLPFELLVDALNPERNLSHTPLFQAMFVMEPLPDTITQLPGLEIQPILQHTGTATFDLTLQISVAPGHIFGSFEYNTDLWERDTIRRMAENYQSLLAAAVADTEQPVWLLPILSAGERRQLLVEWNHTTRPAPYDRTIHALFEEHVRRQPFAEALAFCDLNTTQTLTYRQLDERANQLAHYLLRGGVQMETIVAISTTRSLESIIGILGVLKAGGAYLPLDPNYPADRLAFMLSDSRAPLLLTQADLVASLPLQQAGWPGTPICLDSDWPEIALESTTAPAVLVSPNNLAYVIYTSGSTGRPKGALLEHAGLSNLAEAQRQAFAVAPGCRILQFSPFSFDASVWETAMALANGAALVLTPQEVLASTPDLVRLLQEMRISHITLPPSVLQVLPQEALPDLRVVVAAGEACPAELVEIWSPGRSFFNAYGPTETTVCASMHLCKPGETGMPPIGRPLPNMRLYICDPRGQPVPIGVPGELLVGGINLARGYLDRPELTAEKFTPDPFRQALGDVPGSPRLYRTGDLVRYTPSGEIEFLGRIDQQVKIRGFRVELGEIEEVLRRNPHVLQAAVIARSIRRSGPLNDQLIAYVVPKANASLTSGDMQEFLRSFLPDYMIPSIFLFLEAMPISPAGKIDRRCLPDPEKFALSEEREYVAPEGETEHMLAQVCAELLNIERVGATDNFFDLGGHSLLATQYISRIRTAFQIEIPLRRLFEHPTVRSLAQEVEKMKTEAPAANQPIERVSRDQYRRKRSDLNSSAAGVSQTWSEHPAND